MTIHEGKSKVDMGHLIRVVIPKQYSFDIHIACLSELVANALDAKPRVIQISLDHEKGVLEVTDDGSGMSKQLFEEYHDITSPKVTGSGIGFAGQGAKLALNFCSKVITETISPSYKGYSEWHLEGKDAPYKIHDNQILTLDCVGTRITLRLDDESKAFYTTEFIEQTLKQHYFPLLDEALLKVYMGKSPVLINEKGSAKAGPVTTYRPIYPKGLKFIVNGKQIVQKPLQTMLKRQKEVSITVYKKAKARGFFGLAENGIVETLQGIAICSFGKVIDRTWFKKEPRDKQRIAGWIEAPYLIEAVTTDKCGFQAGNKTWERFFRKAQSEFVKWLEEAGLLEKLSVERKRDFSDLVSEINLVLKNIPELTFFGIKTERDVAIRSETGIEKLLGEGTQKVPGTKGRDIKGKGVSVYPGTEPGQAPTLETGEGAIATPHTRTIRGGINIATDKRPDMDREAWFDGETVVVNESHPAYGKAEREKVLNYHVIKCVCLNLIEFSLDHDPEPSYQKAFDLSQRFFRMWGEV